MSFTGFPVTALDLYDDLEVDSTRSFREAHREVHDTAARVPMTEPCAAPQPEFGAATLVRPYRDLRFAKDERPYKTSQGF